MHKDRQIGHPTFLQHLKKCGGMTSANISRLCWELTPKRKIKEYCTTTDSLLVTYYWKYTPKIGNVGPLNKERGSAIKRMAHRLMYLTYMQPVTFLKLKVQISSISKVLRPQGM